MMKAFLRNLMIKSHIFNVLYTHLHWMRRSRYLYSLRFCYKYLPKKQAKYLPIIFYKGAYAEITRTGKIILEDSFFLNTMNKVLIGDDPKDFTYQCEKTYLRVEGQLSIKGKVSMRRGAMLEVNGIARLGNNVVLGSRCRIRAHNRIEIGDYVRIAHETQVFDTNFHPIEMVDSPGYIPFSQPIRIGSYCWIGNRSTIQKGTVLPDYTIIASYSLIGKDFSKIQPYTIIGGIPAKVIKSGYRRVFDSKQEFEYQCKEFAWYRERYKR